MSFRYRNAKTERREQRTVSGALFLWLVLQHVLPKGFRRARNFGFLHPNCKRLIALLHVLLKFVPGQWTAWIKERPRILCTGCGAVMVIVQTQLRPLFTETRPIPIANSGGDTHQHGWTRAGVGQYLRRAVGPNVLGAADKRYSLGGK